MAPVTRGAVGLLLLVLAGPAAAADLRVSVTEQLTGETTIYALSLGDGHARRAREAQGQPLPAISTYRIEGRRLCARECLAAADEILFQGRHGATDVIVFRWEYNSLSNPVRWMAAMAGHPVQVSSIRVVTVEGGRLKTHSALTRKAASYRWTATVRE